MNRIREIANVIHRGGGYYAVILRQESDILELVVLLQRHCVVRDRLASNVWQVRFIK